MLSLYNLILGCSAYCCMLCLLFHNKPSICYTMTCYAVVPTKGYRAIVSQNAFCAILSYSAATYVLYLLRYIISLLFAIVYLQYHTTPTMTHCGILCLCCHSKPSVRHSIPIRVACYAYNAMLSCNAHCGALCLLYAILILQCHQMLTVHTICYTVPPINKTIIVHQRI